MNIYIYIYMDVYISKPNAIFQYFVVFMVNFSIFLSHFFFTSKSRNTYIYLYLKYM